MKANLRLRDTESDVVTELQNYLNNLEDGGLLKVAENLLGYDNTDVALFREEIRKAYKNGSASEVKPIIFMGNKVE